MIKFQIDDYIAVKDKLDVLKASDILEKIGINVFSTVERKTDFIKTGGSEINNGFLVQEPNGGFRIQKHYISDGMTTNELEIKVNEYLIQYPTSKNDKLLVDLQKEVNTMKICFDKIEKILSEFK